MLFQSHADNTSTSSNLYEAGKTLVDHIDDLAERGKGQGDPNVTSLNRQGMAVVGSDGSVRLAARVNVRVVSLGIN